MTIQMVGWIVSGACWVVVAYIVYRTRRASKRFKESGKEHDFIFGSDQYGKL